MTGILKLIKQTTMAKAIKELEEAERLLAEVHPPHPQPEICKACKFLGRK